MGGGGDRELRQQLEAAEALTHIGSWEWDVVTGRVTWSDELYRIYGLEPGAVEITLELFLSRIDPTHRERIQGEIQAALAKPGRFAYEEMIVRPDGTRRTLDTTGEAIADDTGRVVRLTGICRDVTEIVTQNERIRFYAEVFENAGIGLAAFQLDRSEDPPKLRLVAFNAAAERMFDQPLASRLGEPLAGLVPKFEDTHVCDIARAVAAGPREHRLAPFRLRNDPSAPVVEITLFPLRGEHLGLVLEDVTARVASDHILAGERRALEMLAAGEPLANILGVIVRAIEAASVDTIASILLLDETGTHVRHGAAPGLPAAYNAAVDGQPIGPRAGSCGTAMFRREPVITVDIETDPLWTDYRPLAHEHGLRSCWSFPITGNDGRVLGTFALYRRVPLAPDESAFELMKRAAHVTGIVLERRALDEQRRALAGRIEAAREDERTTIARDIHDQLGQALTALKLDIGWVARRTQVPEIQAKLDEMAHAADDILRSVRRIASDLRPGMLDSLGLRAAIEWQAEEFTQHTSIPCHVDTGVTDLQLERGLATNVFRIFQESLTNIARHANAHRVDVSLALEHGNLRLEIRDDGVGMPEITPRGTTLGLLGMRERAWRLGGACTIRRGTPTGTIVTVVVPLRFPAERSDLQTIVRG